MSKSYIAGVGMTPFVKPGQNESFDRMAEVAIRAAIQDAAIDIGVIEEATAGFVMGDSCCGQEALYRVGLTGIPVQNVENACASGSSAVYLARRAVESGEADVALAFGFEQMPAGAPPSSYLDRPMYSRLIEAARQIQGWDDKVPIPFQIFGGAAIELQQKHGVSAEVFAMISVKARRHAAHNPNALFREQLTVEDVLASKPVWGPLTRFQCSPPTCGAAAAVIVSERFKRRHGMSQAVLIAGQGLATDTESSFAAGSMIKVSGHDVSRRAADIAYERAGIGPGDIHVVELHDCFSSNELVCYEALRLVEEGGAARMVMDGDNTYGGKFVVNPSGGLLAKGHPIGATGVAQMVELVWQLRGSADQRQVPGARVGLQHNIGLGSASVVTILRR